MFTLLALNEKEMTAFKSAIGVFIAGRATLMANTDDVR